MPSAHPIPPPAIPAKENLYIEWPQLVIEKILNKIASEESEEMISVLLNCRLVDKYWNEIIEDDFMKKLSFIIREDPTEFLNLPIVQKGKVKSITLTKYWLSWRMKPKVKNAIVKNFIDAISNNSIEKVHFSFEEGNRKSEFELFKFIVGVCTNLQELIISQLITRKMSPGENLLEQITDKIEIISSNKIHTLEVNMDRFTQGSAIGVATLLSKLPQLRKIKLIGSCRSEWGAAEPMLPICRQMIEYLNKFKIGLQLKELTLPRLTCCFDEETINTFNSLLILCGKNSVVIEGEISHMDLNSLLNLPEISAAQLASPNQQQQYQGPLFKGKVIGGFIFDDESTTITNASLDLLGELDIRRLQIDFKTDISSGQLNWIAKLKQLEFLVLYPKGEIGDRDYKDDDEDEVRTLNQESEEEVHRAFSAGLFTLKRLHIAGDLFSSTRVYNWALFFPNLNELTIKEVYYTTNDMISQLIALESLAKLYLTGLEKLQDNTFTADCVNRYSSDLEESSSSSAAVNVVVVPAIACFKSLKYLRVCHCSLLTNKCVINGIAKCKALEKVKILRCKKMTKRCLKYLECNASFIPYES